MTPLQQLLDLKLVDSGGLAKFIDTHRAQGRSWSVVARELYDATGQHVNTETIRLWHTPTEVAS